MKPPFFVVALLAAGLTIVGVLAIICIAQPALVLSFGNPHSISETQIHNLGWAVLIIVAICSFGCTSGLPPNNSPEEDEHLANFD